MLTVKDAARDETVRDDTLLSDMPPDVPVFRTFYPDLTLVYLTLRRLRMRRLAYYATRFIHTFPPDHCIGWVPFAYIAGKRIIAEEKIDVIYTQSGPYSDHLIGYLLKRSTGKPWVADFRDEWTQCLTLYNPLFQWQRKLNVWMEQQVLLTADRIIMPTESYREAISCLVPPEMRDKFLAITNGYDQADFETDLLDRDDKLTFVYAGMFYGPQQPTHFLSAVRALIEEGKISPENVSLVFVGGTGGGPGLDSSNIQGLENLIKNVGLVSHREAIRFMREADVLWLIVGNQRGKGNIPGKVFEYVATGNPVLALVPCDGEAADLLRRTKTALAIVEPEDVYAIKEAILRLYKDWQHGELRIDPNWPEIRRYESRALTKRMTEVLEAVGGSSQKSNGFSG